MRNLIKSILRHTEICRQSLTPEIGLSLITNTCPLYHLPVTNVNSPFLEPFWAFYWIGGQAMSRFVFDNISMFEGQRILDVGCGCGASSIAALMTDASSVTANDIDPVGLVASWLNARRNLTSSQLLNFNVSNYNIVQDILETSWPQACPKDNFFRQVAATRPETLAQGTLLPQVTANRLINIDIILMGDIFYDPTSASTLLRFIHRCRQINPAVKIFLADPGRPAFSDIFGTISCRTVSKVGQILPALPYSNNNSATVSTSGIFSEISLPNNSNNRSESIMRLKVAARIELPDWLVTENPGFSEVVVFEVCGDATLI